MTRSIATLLCVPVAAVVLSALAPPAQQAGGTVSTRPEFAGFVLTGTATPVYLPASGGCTPGHFAAAPEGSAARRPFVYPVRPVPDRNHVPHDTVRAGERGFACDNSAAPAPDAEGDGPVRWLGVVYGRSAESCGLDRTGSRRRAYTGPCRWGWVEAEHFRADLEDVDVMAINEPPGGPPAEPHTEN